MRGLARPKQKYISSSPITISSLVYFLFVSSCYYRRIFVIRAFRPPFLLPFFFHLVLSSSPYLQLAQFSFVTQINHWVTAGTPPPSPLRCVPSSFIARRGPSADSSLVDSRRIVRTPAINRRVLLLIANFAQKNAHSVGLELAKSALVSYEVKPRDQRGRWCVPGTW